MLKFLTYDGLYYERGPSKMDVIHGSPILLPSPWELLMAGYCGAQLRLVITKAEMNHVAVNLSCLVTHDCFF